MDIDPDDNHSDHSSISTDLEMLFCDTKEDPYGVYLSFPCKMPSWIPAGTFSALCDSPSFNVLRSRRNWWSGITNMSALPPDPVVTKDDTIEEALDSSQIKQDYYKPFTNAASFLLINWFYSRSNIKTLAELDHLVHAVILNDDFRHEDLLEFCAAREAQRVDNLKNDTLADSLLSVACGWKKTTVKIHVPFECIKNSSVDAALEFEVNSLYYRRPVEIVRAILQEQDVEGFHLFPFRMYWKADKDSKPERVYSELYNLDVYLEEHERIRRLHATPTCEIIVAAMMLWSDSTQLANFGTASLWPVYLFFGNQSKYAQCKPGNFVAHHVAYIPKVRLMLSDP